jgi:hypothetical protein
LKNILMIEFYLFIYLLVAVLVITHT